MRVDSSRGVVVQRFQRAANSGSLSGQARGSLSRTGTDRQVAAGVAGEVAGVVGDSGTGGPRADPVYRLHLGDQVGGGQTRPFVTEVEERLGGGAQRTPFERHAQARVLGVAHRQNRLRGGKGA